MPRTAQHWDSKRYTVYRDQFVKTQLCRYYAAGTCTKGENCSFAHGTVELGNTPDLKKTALCEDFKKGKCPHPSHECIYAHGQDELRSSPAFHAMQKDSPSSQASAVVENKRGSVKGHNAVPAVPKNVPARKKLRSQSGSSNDSGSSEFSGKEVPFSPVLAKTIQEPAPQHPQHHQMQVNQSQNNVKSLLGQQQQLLQALGALNNPSSDLPAYQQVPASLCPDMQLRLLPLLHALNEMTKADPALASRLVPPGLPAAGQWPVVAAPLAAGAMAKDMFDLKPKILGGRIYDDEPWTVPLPRFASFSEEHPSMWQL